MLCWSNKSNFRKEIYPEYKAHRKNNRKPLCLKRIKEKLSYAYHYNLEKEGYEADDIIGELISAPDPYRILYNVDEPVKTQNNRAVCVTIDKDLRTVPGLHYIDGELVTITEGQADFTWMCQTLAGDSVDNIEGVKGIGIKRAEKILKGIAPEGKHWTLGYLWHEVKNTYSDHGYTPRQTWINARLTRIQRDGDTIDKLPDPIGIIF